MKNSVHKLDSLSYCKHSCSSMLPTAFSLVIPDHCAYFLLSTCPWQMFIFFKLTHNLAIFTCSRLLADKKFVELIIHMGAQLHRKLRQDPFHPMTLSHNAIRTIRKLWSWAFHPIVSSPSSKNRGHGLWFEMADSPVCQQDVWSDVCILAQICLAGFGWVGGG